MKSNWLLNVLNLLFNVVPESSQNWVANFEILLKLILWVNVNSQWDLLIRREGDSTKAAEKRALTTQENSNSHASASAVAVVIEKPSFLKLNKEGKATSTTASCHTENESALWLAGWVWVGWRWEKIGSLRMEVFGRAFFFSLGSTPSHRVILGWRLFSI